MAPFTRLGVSDIVKSSLDVEKFKLLIWKYTTVFFDGEKEGLLFKIKNTVQYWEFSDKHWHIWRPPTRFNCQIGQCSSEDSHYILNLNCSRASTYQKAYKLQCVFPIVVVSVLPHADFGRNDHREDVPHFNIKQSLLTCWNKNNNSCINFLFVLFPHIGFFAVARLRILLLMLCNYIC